MSKLSKVLTVTALAVALSRLHLEHLLMSKLNMIIPSQKIQPLLRLRKKDLP